MEEKVKKSTIPTKFFCNLCNKFYASPSSLCHHNKKFHKIESNTNVTNVTIPVTNVTIPVIMSTNHNQLEKKNICEYCNKNFANRHSKSEHKKKSCKFNPNNNNENENILLKNEINELKDKINILLKSNKIHPKTLQKINTQNNNIQNNNIQNNNINNNIQNNNINVTYVKFGNEKLSEILSENEMKKILSHVRLSIEESIKLVHFNNERPQYKNIFITNMRDNCKIIKNYKFFIILYKTL